MTYREAALAWNSHVDAGYDSMVSVTEVRNHVWNANHQPITFDRARSAYQYGGECEPLFYQNGAFFVQTLQAWLDTRYFYGDNPYLYRVDGYEAHDVNTPADWELAKLLQGSNLL
jgi:CMP-N-acetylneuraminic acid synthetase